MPTKTDTQFKDGNRSGRGRPAGKRNKMTRLLKEAALLAAESIGEDGNGKDGLVGYLRTSAILERAAYLSFLGKLLPMQVSATLPQLRVILAYEAGGVGLRGVARQFNVSVETVRRCLAR